MRHIAFLLSTLAALGAVHAQENYVSSWSGHKNVVLNTHSVQGGAAVSGNVYNFPVLVRLGTADSAIFIQSKAGGADLRFTKANNTTRLPHQIESWNAAGRSAAVWVLVDTVRGMRNNQYIRMHWGNSSANDSSSGTQTFRTANGFQAVWHMNGASAACNETDATANGLTATQNSNPATATGMIAGGRFIANATTTATQYFNVANSASPLNFSELGTYTVSAWVNLNSVATHATVVSKHDLAYALKTDKNSTWEFFEFGTGSGWNAVNGNGAEAGTWQLLMGVQNGGDMAFYQNGQRVDAGVISTANGGTHSTDQDLLIGAEPQTATTRRRPLDGIVDEVRIASASRTADWAKLEYENQKVGQTLVRLLDTVPPLSIFSAHGFGENFSMQTTGAGMVFRVLDPRASAVRISIMDLQGRSVWSYRGAAAEPVTWDGVSVTGKRASQGLYMVRVDLIDASGAKAGSIERRLPLTR